MIPPSYVKTSDKPYREANFLLVAATRKTGGSGRWL